MKNLIYLFFVTGFIIFPEFGKTQSPKKLENLVQKFVNFYSQLSQQKIYVHTDKPYYISGDNILGKVYLINEKKSGYDSINSKKIYVELINEDNTVVQKAIINGLNSNHSFSFNLNDSIVEGNYLLRAYSAWMLHYGNTFFCKYIHIFNTPNHIVSNITYPDSTFSTATIQIHDSLKKLDLNKQIVQYHLLYKNKIISRDQTITNQEGKFSLNVSAIPLINRCEAAIYIKTGNYEKLLNFPYSGDDLDVQFLPEGGYLINGLDNNIAFKAINKKGHGINVDGYVKDSKGDIICNLKSTHLGMGKLSFIPTANNSYTAFIKQADSKIFTYPIPSANDYAYQVSVVKQNEESVSVRVALGDSLYKKKIASYLVATSHSNIYFTSQGIDQYQINIPLKTFPEGIAQITLFNNKMQPVSERLIYVYHPEPKVILTTNKDDYRSREKISLLFKVSDLFNKALNGMYSLSVTDDHTVKIDENDGNIKSYLLLSPYLKGYLEQPGTYFKTKDTLSKENLDLLMLTHGWSRFKWMEIIDNTVKIKPTEKDSNLTIIGKLSNKNGTPVKYYTVSLFSKTDNTYIGSNLTNEKGEFKFTGLDYSDSTIFFIQVKNLKELNLEVNSINFPLIEVDRSLIPDNFSSKLLGLNNFSFILDTKYKLLSEVKVTNTRHKVNYYEAERVSQQSYIITSDYLEKFSNINLRDALYSVPGVTIMDGHISFFGINSMTKYTDPLIIMNGVEFPDAMNINPYEVDFIEVLRGGEAAIYGERAGNGVIIVHPKKGRDSYGPVSQTGIKEFQLPGYFVEKDYYFPKYETEESRQMKPKDERTTIYWNGNLNTEANGTINDSFYSADARTTYTVTIEGITEDGEFIHQTFSIKRTKI